jgi:putative ABC transport system permease protein
MTRVLTRPTVLRAPDALGEAGTAITARPVPAIATSFGSMLAVAWFVAVLGLVSTATGQVTSAFAARLPTTVQVTTPASRLPDPPFPYPGDVAARVESLPGVVAAGAWWTVSLNGHPVTVTPSPVAGGPAPDGASPPVIAATPGFLTAAGVQVSAGRTFGAWDQSHAASTCLVGSVLARTMNLGLGKIYLGDMACTVTGIVARAPAEPSILGSVVLPASTATLLFGSPGAGPALLIRVRPGAAATVARLAPYAISAARPHRYIVSLRPGPTELGRAVLGILNGLFKAAALAGVALGLIGLSCFSFFSVSHRIPELALRRALGARRRHLAVHVLTESALLGLLGGIAGASLGVAVIVLAARAMNWTPVIDPLIVWSAPLTAAATGIIAGAIAAARAAWTTPARALRKFPLQ